MEEGQTSRQEGQFPVTWPPSLSNSNYKDFFFKRANELEVAVEEGQMKGRIGTLGRQHASHPPLVRFGKGSHEGARPAMLATAKIDEQPSPEQRLAQKDVRECLRGEIAKLPDSLRTLFMLSALGGLSDEKIAQTLGITHANAKVRLHRARREFRKIIAARCDFYRDELSCKPSSPDCCPPATPADTPTAEPHPPV